MVVNGLGELLNLKIKKMKKELQAGTDAQSSTSDQDKHVSSLEQNPVLSAVPFGMQVIVNDMACISKERKQFRFPKSKKVRIRKKWSKRNINYRLEDVHKAVKIGDKLLVSSKVFETLKKLPGIADND